MLPKISPVAEPGSPPILQVCLCDLALPLVFYGCRSCPFPLRNLPSNGISEALADPSARCSSINYRARLPSCRRIASRMSRCSATTDFECIQSCSTHPGLKAEFDQLEPGKFAHLQRLPERAFRRSDQSRGTDPQVVPLLRRQRSPRTQRSFTNYHFARRRARPRSEQDSTIGGSPPLVNRGFTQFNPTGEYDVPG